ncbi:zinc metalloprotease [Halopelagius longus]|uniref:Matrixin n=1 Tax=Halopelagius longus TaxID=1236180 RepID=A0A1H0XQN5_9EURY|nr:matrixin family metalloprotease [Halopelagius longus]RDI72020.1 matrixin [Halopelagius longus]SDQ05129.1 Matrixin [Halopelagius longus]
MSRASLRAVALAVLVVLAGCAVPVDIPTDDPSVGPSTPTDAPTDGTADSPTPDGTATDADPTATAHPDRESPWGDDPIVVGVRDTADTDRNWAPLVREATAYWEERAEHYAGYPVEYAVRPDAENPDIVVRFVENIEDCENAAEAAGCAPLVEDSRQIRRPARVSIRTGFSNSSTVLVLKHEFGHTLGLRHDDAPADVMASRSILYTESQPNATEREFPWEDEEFTVHVNTSGAREPEAAREQVEHAFGYYEGAPPGVPDNVSVEYVSDPADAEVTVRFAETPPCSAEAASCAGTTGWDPDGDGAVETYSGLEIVVAADTDADAVGWHVGYWFAYALGMEDDSEKPPPFRDATYEERRSEWWR